MSNIKFKGNPVQVSGTIPGVGEKIEDFTFVKVDLSEGSLADYADKVKVLMAVPSLDTGICQKEARAFNELIGKMEGVIGLTVSKDLPFAMNRFCSAEGIEDIISASDFRYNDFGSQNGIEMTDGPLKGLFARVVFVLDKDNKITYKEEVDDITHEPNYEAAVAAVKALV
ncbi:MAG: thiol peroxidase [Bacteroidetes bacterium]|nr:MAG: thiol peroxidase [Bacteroidota bacterium]MBL1144192.1 thiol peroxidase [Bacteroidota bacterium]MCB0804113.1 thiol peroxidase [Flavobacteriales bacterium]NOG56988.1 thiol peroxidase [Bacteroidota bacterium]